MCYVRCRSFHQSLSLFKWVGVTRDDDSLFVPNLPQSDIHQMSYWWHSVWSCRFSKRRSRWRIGRTSLAQPPAWCRSPLWPYTSLLRYAACHRGYSLLTIKANQFKWSANLPFIFLKGNRCEHLKCLVLSNQQAKTQRFSVYCDRFWRKQADVQGLEAAGCEDLKEKFTHKWKVSHYLLTTMQMENGVKLLTPF